MKQIFAILMIVCLAFSTPIYAANEAFDDCLLTHLKGAKQDNAAHLIRLACTGLYNRSGVLLENRRLFLNCLLEHLVGVESAQAVEDIHLACGRKYD
ncbi:MAG: VF_A0006 family four-cysteine protein [Candidatus Thiodiazotropha sp.]